MSANVIQASHAAVQGIEKFIRAGALPAIKRVVWETTTSGCYTTGDAIHLPLPSTFADPAELLLWRYKTEHELGHEDPINSHPHWKPVLAAAKAAKADSITCMVANILSDFTQERNRIGKYTGRDTILLDGREAFLRTVWAGMRYRRAPGDPRFDALWELDNTLRMQWNPRISAKPMPANVKAWAKRMLKVGNWLAVRNEQECMDLALELRKLFDQDPQPPPGEGEGEGEGEDGKQTQVGAGKTDPHLIQEADEQIDRHKMHVGNPQGSYTCIPPGTFVVRKPSRI